MWSDARRGDGSEAVNINGKMYEVPLRFRKNKKPKKDTDVDTDDDGDDDGDDQGDTDHKNSGPEDDDTGSAGAATAV